MALRTVEEVKKELSDNGLTVSDWAREMGYSPALVYQVFSGRLKCTSGQSHRVAVALGLKKGKLGKIEDLSFVKEVRNQQNLK